MACVLEPGFPKADPVLVLGTVSAGLIFGFLAAQFVSVPYPAPFVPYEPALGLGVFAFVCLGVHIVYEIFLSKETWHARITQMLLSILAAVALGPLLAESAVAVISGEWFPAGDVARTTFFSWSAHVAMVMGFFLIVCSTLMIYSLLLVLGVAARSRKHPELGKR